MLEIARNEKGVAKATPFWFDFEPTVRQTAAKTPFLRSALAHTSARASDKKMPNTEGPLPVICVQTAP